MGSCLSKKTTSFPPNAATASQSVDPHKSCTISIGNNNLKLQKKKFSLSPKEEEEEERQQQQQQQGEEVKFRKEVEQESLVKKEIFVIKHRKSQDRDKRSPPPAPSLPPPNTNPPLPVKKDNVPTAREPAAAAARVAATPAAEMGVNNISNADGTVRTSSCTKEEVDAILIQCGILSRSNSTGAGKAASSSSGRRYSGSKRSFDLDHRGADAADVQCEDQEDNQEAVAEARQHRQRHHHRRQSPSSSQGRRRTPSRERDQNSASSGRRLSRSPARKRSETTTTAPNAADNRPRPAKMLSVPAASLAMDKSNNSVETQTQTAPAVKRISVKRCSSPVPVNVAEAASAAAVVGSRTTASPRSRSPARVNAAKGCNDNNQQQPSLSRSSSRKAEHSPYRRNPLTEIDQNSMPYSQPAASKATCLNNSSSRGGQPKTKEIDGQVAVKESVSFLDQKPKIEVNNKNFAQGTNCGGCNLGQLDNKDPEEQQQNVEKANGQAPLTSNVVTATIIPSGIDSLNPQALTRSRSARRSRDLDLNPETFLNPTSSYTALLLEDIQNFHQKNTNPSFSVPPCVTKACSILEAVADLNSTTSSNLSGICSNGRRSHLPAATLAGKKTSEAREPFLESEILKRDDLMEPSFHKYVTVTRGGMLYGSDMDGQESSGSNSFVDGSQQHWGLSASLWEPNSADSTDCWTSRSNNREGDDDNSPPGFQKHMLSEPGHDMEKAMRKSFSGQRTGIGRGRLGTTRNLHATAVVAATAST